MPDEVMPDEVMPSGGGVMRGLGAVGAGFAGVFSAVELVFAPNAYNAREEIETQRRIGPRKVSPADPPTLDPAELAARGVRLVVYRWSEPPARSAVAAGDQSKTTSTQ
jgi:hypothetical protein